MEDKPKIKYVDVKKFDDDTVRQVFGPDTVCVIETLQLTREEIEKIWPGAIKE
jgi:hypothetical protein